MPFVTEFEYLLDELVEIIWNWVVMCVAIMLCVLAERHTRHDIC